MDVEEETLVHEEKERLCAAIEQLQPQQQDLVRRVYYNDEKLIDIAREQGVTRAALSIRMQKIHAALKKILSEGLNI